MFWKLLQRGIGLDVEYQTQTSKQNKHTGAMLSKEAPRSVRENCVQLSPELFQTVLSVSSVFPKLGTEDLQIASLDKTYAFLFNVPRPTKMVQTYFFSPWDKTVERTGKQCYDWHQRIQANMYAPYVSAMKIIMGPEHDLTCFRTCVFSRNKVHSLSHLGVEIERKRLTG